LNQGLFRKEAVDAQTTPSLGAVRLATPISHQVWTIAALGLSFAIALWLCEGQYTRREHVSGSLVPQAGLLTIMARSSGTVAGINVTEGAVVHAGDVLLTLSSERSSVSMGDTSAAISAQLRLQQSRLQSELADARHLADEQAHDLRMQQSMLNGQLRQIDAQSAIARRQVASLSALLGELQAIGKSGYVSALDIQQQQTQELTAETQVKALLRQRYEGRQQLMSVTDQLKQLPLATAEKLSELRRQMAQNQQSLAQNEADRATVLRAPENGVVSAILTKQGQAAVVGQSLLAIMPLGSPLQAQLLVPSSAIGFVHPGAPVVLHYQAFPYQKFGVQHGNVASVSRSALKPSEVTLLLGQQPPAEPVYRVQVQLAAQDICAYGKLEMLKPGMVLDADLLLDKRRMIEWIFEPLFGMSERYTGAADD
jgi:membrane fusion protein